MRRSITERMRPPSCRLKNHYPEQEWAEKARVRLQEKHGWLFRIYLCDLCDEFHLARVKRDGKAVPYIRMEQD